MLFSSGISVVVASASAGQRPNLGPLQTLLGVRQAMRSDYGGAHDWLAAGTGPCNSAASMHTSLVGAGSSRCRMWSAFGVSTRGTYLMYLLGVPTSIDRPQKES